MVFALHNYSSLLPSQPFFSVNCLISRIVLHFILYTEFKLKIWSFKLDYASLNLSYYTFLIKYNLFFILQVINSSIYSVYHFLSILFHQEISKVKISIVLFWIRISELLYRIARCEQ